MVLLEHFLTNEECDELIELSRGTLEPARVVDVVSRKGSFTSARISIVGLRYGPEHALIRRIEQRIEILTRWPSSHFQPAQVAHYRAGDAFKLHHDFFNPAVPAYRRTLRLKGQRLATLIMYLNDCPSSGHTVFPLLDGWFVSPLKGNALFFSYAGSDDEPDRHFLHGAAPILSGEKWIATTWLCAQPQYRAQRPPQTTPRP